MKTTVKRAIRDQEGNVLILVLVVLVVGGLILTPLLGLMGTGLVAGQVYEKKTAELYAADAGVEDAIWRISNNLTGTGEPFFLNVNDKDVEFAIDRTGCRSYRIVSVATTDSVSSTTIQADLFGLSFPDNAITSRENVDLGNNSLVEGRIQYGNDLTWDPKADFDQENTIHEVYTNWPSSGDLYSYYYPRYIADKDFEYCYNSTCVIDAGYTPTVGPLYRVGKLDLMSSDPKVKKELALTGTIYVTDNLGIGDAPEAKDFTLNLNGQTIFCEGNIMITGKTDIIGAGNIIAKGDIYFEPNFTSSDDYILLLALEGNLQFMPAGDFTGFVMSADGEVFFKPGGIFYGSVAGDVQVDLDSSVTVIYAPGLDDLIDFPFEAFANWRIRSWNIS